MNKLKRSSFLFTAFLALSLLISACGERRDEQASGNTQQQQQIPSIDVADTSKGNTNTGNADNSIVRQGVVDLKAIDQNNDGKVYQCPMDFNVVADNQTPCPQCKMDLEQYTLEKAGANLKEAGFQVK